ncbi:tetratricopeptide repeat protein [Avibacterium avium]|uniref:tetratricopeptide repeat protein n=1 Tax=Avibacterium avium TaxID=751 RepID=UPI003BF81489
MKFTKTLLTTALFSFSVLSASQMAYAETNDAELVQLLSGGEQLQQALEALLNDELDTAISLAQPLAEQGNVVAQNALGLAYEGKEEYFQAFKWYQKAAEQGLAKAQFNLGHMYYNGQGVKQDYFQAFKWTQKAAEQGDAKAQYSLGYLYDKGRGVKQDDFQAVKWYQKAAEQGYADAQTNLGVRYALGKGVKLDRNLAKMWAGKGCDNGNQNGCELYRILNEGK